MRVLIPGHDGYIGSVLVPYLQQYGHEIYGIDSLLYGDCGLYSTDRHPPFRQQDIRDLHCEDLDGFDAVVNLAALCNDPLGELNAECTDAINHRGAVHLARIARQAGVPHFIQASTCSLYGASAGDWVDESSSLHVVSRYGSAKLAAEQALRLLSGDGFTVSLLRFATAYGDSPKLRSDLVVNNLVGYALTTGEIRVRSDGRAWRPLIHVADMAESIRIVLEHPLPGAFCRTFNVGDSGANYRVADIAAAVRDALPGTSVCLDEKAAADPRSYRVRCDRFAAAFPAFRPAWDLKRGIEQLVDSCRRHQLTYDTFTGPALNRLARIRELQQQQRLDADLRLRSAPEAIQAG
jgi:nucleoside-diphosphate-sugar epimerase